VAVTRGVKQLGREADQSPASSAEVKNDGATNSLPHTSSCRDAQLTKPRDNLSSSTLPVPIQNYLWILQAVGGTDRTCDQPVARPIHTHDNTNTE
jgi:hypothetical protein